MFEFGEFRLSKERAELIGPGGPVSIERSPLNVLIYLVENAERVVSRDDLIEAVWGGRIVSDATISTAIKLARQAVGDTGSTQKIIRTVHGRGFRFVADFSTSRSKAAVRPRGTVSNIDASESPTPVGSGHPSLAVLRFQSLGNDRSVIGLSSAFPAELITSLSRLKWLHLISRGSSFRFDPTDYDSSEVGKKLGARYLLGGIIEVVGDKLTITVELQTSRDGALVWGDRFSAPIADIHVAREQIASAVISAMELSIPQFEAAGSRRLNAEEFDAWSHFHLGLSHIYRFNVGDNLIAADHFRAALDLDPTFGRAHAGLSFTHWQNAFMQFGDNRIQLVDQAILSAGKALEIDANDPFSNFNMGRARWLLGDIDGSQNWLDRALQINPNFAQCHYNSGLISALEGASTKAQMSAIKAQSLSPLDPLFYAMLGVQALGHLAEDEFAEGATKAEQAMNSPNAHFYIALIAATARALNGDIPEAEQWRDQALVQRPDASINMFLAAFPFKDADLRRKFTHALQRVGLS